jgi:anti-anti-sigma regulatory factor
MAIRNLTQGIVLVELPSEASKRADELKEVNETFGAKCNCDVIVDLSSVEIIHSWNISNLLILRGLLQDAGRQLILCGVTTLTKCIFRVAGLSDVFIFANDTPAAEEMIRNPKPATSSTS